MDSVRMPDWTRNRRAQRRRSSHRGRCMHRPEPSNQLGEMPEERPWRRLASRVPLKGWPSKEGDSRGAAVAEEQLKVHGPRGQQRCERRRRQLGQLQPRSGQREEAEREPPRVTAYLLRVQALCWRWLV